MDTGAALGGTGLFISIAGVIYSAINHKHIKSKCCGKEYDVSIDIGTTQQVNDAAKTGEQKEKEQKTEIVGKVETPYKPMTSRVFPKIKLDP